ncbi:MAG TPA: CHAT domain-containing protein, partial [Thermoguttaceae bacterium]|nr:CHAT domain-containing protein [Thermoguttaceae bacterium]
LNFLTATVLFQQKKLDEGNAALTAAMTYMRGGSQWLFHIGLTDNLYGSGDASPRDAMELYDEVLRDPQPADWASDPMEAMAVLVTPHPVPIDHWFEVALQRKEHEKAMEIADRARRHRFFSSLAYGGRLQSLRWILEGHEDTLDQQSQLLRQDLLARYPDYAALSQQSQEIRTRLAPIPLVPDDPEAIREQGRELSQLESVSNQQEAVLHEMALRREPATLVFPPLRPTLAIQKSLSEGQALLVFYATGRHLYAFLMNNERYSYWQVGSPATLSKRVAALLREMGQFQQNHEVTLEDAADVAWKQSAKQLLDDILEGSRADFTQHFEELVIVPDGVLWYVPFEALQVDVDGRSRPLISRFRIRYAPTASLATSSGRGHSPTGNTAVVTGKLFPRDDESVSQTAFEDLAKVVPGAVALKSPLPAPSSVYGSLFDRLIVLDDLKTPGAGGDASDPYDWALVPLDRGKAGSSLSDWLRLPWGGPDEILLPGFHTAAESSLAGVDQAAPGNEMLLSVCGLMAGGARTVLLSRWRTGGQTSFDLVREFSQELPHTTPSDAWQRAVFLAAGSQLNPAAEPRIKQTVAGNVPKANHPFFWAGYLLIDPGTQPFRPDAATDEPLQFQKP